MTAPAFQCFHDPQGNLQVTEGMVMQAETGVVLTVGGGGGGAIAANLPTPSPSLYTPAQQPAATAFVGGSGRNFIATGLPGAAALNGFYLPQTAGQFRNGDFTLTVTAPGAAMIRDAVDVVAILSTGNAAPAGTYAATTYGAATYHSSAAFSLVIAPEIAGGGAIPSILISITGGLAQGGIYTATGIGHYQSAADPDWTLVVAPGGSAELRYLTTTIATRAEGKGDDPSGGFVATEAGLFYHPQPAPAMIQGAAPASNPFGILTLVYSWPATPDLDTRTSFLAGSVGWPGPYSAPYLTHSGDNTGAAGSESITIDLAAAWAAGEIATFADVAGAADWYPPAGGSGVATLQIDYTIGPLSVTRLIAPGSGSPAATPVAFLRVLADGSITGDGAVWTAQVQVIPRVPRAGIVYIQIVKVVGVLTAVHGPIFASALPATSGETSYLALAKCDGTVLTQLHTGALVVAGPAAGGAAWVSLTQAAYDALSPPAADTIYDITDAPWTP